MRANLVLVSSGVSSSPISRTYHHIALVVPFLGLYYVNTLPPIIKFVAIAPLDVALIFYGSSSRVS
ncbi:hypothetical protein [Anabaena sp. 4-3]|uniref:hypothetical protein n=1 Tax=Anabaena sp. 4-3 TaxID=1811979 RepID=UPI000AB5EC84|nr:hypothetical protein [Anabaena sp. 4-3]